MKLRTFFIPLLAASALLAGCETTTKVREPSYADARNDQFIVENRKAAQALTSQLQQSNAVMLIGTLANVDTLEQSTTFGRIVSEQISAQFTQQGFNMLEMKFRESVYVQNNQGEFMLTRQVSELANLYAAQAVVVGSYAESRDFVYVNLKVIAPQTNAVMAVHDYALPINGNTRRMLKSR